MVSAELPPLCVCITNGSKGKAAAVSCRKFMRRTVDDDDVRYVRRGHLKGDFGGKGRMGQLFAGRRMAADFN